VDRNPSSLAGNHGNARPWAGNAGRHWRCFKMRRIWTAREIGPGMAAQGCLDNEGKCVENRLFYPVGRGFTVSRNVSPDFENIGFA